MKRSWKWFAASVVPVAAIVATVLLLTGGRAGSVSAQPQAVTYTPSSLVAQLAQQADVGQLASLVSAGSGDNSVSIVTGESASGTPCWTVTFGGGRIAGPFRCGSAPAPEGPLKIFPDISGPPGSNAATSVTLVGLARGDIASVEAKLLNGSTTDLPVTNGTFGYAATSASLLPTSIRAYGKAGDLLAEQAIGLPGVSDR